MASFARLFKQDQLGEEREKFISEDVDVDMCDVTDKSSDVMTGTGSSEVSRPLLYRKSPMSKKGNWSPELKVLISLNIACFGLVGIALCCSFVLWGQIQELKEQQETIQSKLQECMDDKGLLVEDFPFEPGETIHPMGRSRYSQGDDNDLIQGFKNVIIQGHGEKETIEMKSESIVVSVYKSHYFIKCIVLLSVQLFGRLLISQ